MSGNPGMYNSVQRLVNNQALSNNQGFPNGVPRREEQYEVFPINPQSARDWQPQTKSELGSTQKPMINI
jgi:hypothetical protein